MDIKDMSFNDQTKKMETTSTTIGGFGDKVMRTHKRGAKNILNTMWSLHYAICGVTCKIYCCYLRTKAAKYTTCYGPVWLFENKLIP